MSSTTSDESNENEPSEKQQRFPAILIIGEKSGEVQPYPIKINEIDYILIDTPGLIPSDEQSSRDSSRDIISQIDELIQKSNRMSKAQKENFRQIINAYWNIIIIVFTKRTQDQTTSRQYMETTFDTELRRTVGKRGIITG
ncbi:18716_t:CDS:2, partial [Racocetra fulgida]